MRRFVCGLVSISALVLGCATPSAQTTKANLFLEEVEGAEALAWVRGENERSTQRLEADPRFQTFRAQAEAIFMAKDRIPMVTQRRDRLYNFWRDEKSVRGVLRRTSAKAYVKGRPKWETVIDIDQLAARENENWVYSGLDCLPGEESRCLISLSRGGKDADVVREFDLKTKQFVVNGFQLPEAKSSVTWWNQDVVLAGSDFGPGSLTKAGYPRQVRLWRRGQSLMDAPILFQSEETDVSASAIAVVTPNDRELFVVRSINFFENQYFWVDKDLRSLRRIDVPSDVEFVTLFMGHIILTPRKPWTLAFSGGTRQIAPGELIALDFRRWLKDGQWSEPSTLFKADSQQAFLQVGQTRSALLLTYLENVQTKIDRVTFSLGLWRRTPLRLPPGLTATPVASSSYREDFFILAEDFLNPSRLLYAKSRRAELATVQQMPARFQSEGLKVSQHWATSADGTKIPYFEIGRANALGARPTLLSAYGGFEVSMTPRYSGGMGKAWLERGGTYVLANIRGGGEFGPTWHQAGLRENRQRVFDDFIAVAENLIQRGVTTPAQLGIEGGSNGGLLVAAVTTQRPELFGAVVCSVPLTDMLNYHRWLAGASWMGEYGDPDDPKMRKALLAYSPLHNLSSRKTYPEILFITSTKDDRVHPAHARKMAFQMKEFGKPFLYYENIEGGHGAAANLRQRAYNFALQYAYLSEKLGLDTPAAPPAPRTAP